jgi:hypothetical protein
VLVEPVNHDFFVEICKNRGHRNGVARSEPLLRDLTGMWEQVKAILEENYATRRMIFYCACKKFSRWHDKDEKMWSLGSKVDQMQSELRLATSNMCTSKELEGAFIDINYLACACFIQGL